MIFRSITSKFRRLKSLGSQPPKLPVCHLRLTFCHFRHKQEKLTSFWLCWLLVMYCNSAIDSWEWLFRAKMFTGKHLWVNISWQNFEPGEILCVSIKQINKILDTNYSLIAWRMVHFALHRICVPCRR